MNISSKEIIFLTIFIVFGRIVNNLKYNYNELFPLHTYKYRFQKINSITKITKYLYTSIYNDNMLYMIFNIPYNNCNYYTHNELMFTKSVFTFIIIFLLQYLDNNYVNIFNYDNHILFIIDYCYTVKLINNLGITKIDKSHIDLSNNYYKSNNKSIINQQHLNNIYKTNDSHNTINFNEKENIKKENIKKEKLLEEILEEEIILNTYTLCWIKYIKSKYSFIFILYLCYFSKYKYNNNTIIIDKYNINLIQNIKHVISMCNKFNKNDISNIIKINANYFCINFKYIKNIIMDESYILKFLNKNIVMYNNFKYQITVILKNILYYYENEYNKHINNNKDIINNSGFFTKISIKPYMDELINDTFI